MSLSWKLCAPLVVVTALASSNGSFLQRATGGRGMAQLFRRCQRDEVLAAQSNRQRERQGSPHRMALALGRSRAAVVESALARRTQRRNALDDQRDALYGDRASGWLRRSIRQPGTPAGSTIPRATKRESRTTEDSSSVDSATGPTARAERLFVGTADAYLLSIDARTGKPDPAFGTEWPRRSHRRRTRCDSGVEFHRQTPAHCRQRCRRGQLDHGPGLRQAGASRDRPCVRCANR